MPIVAKVTPTFSQDKNVLSLEKKTLGSMVVGFFFDDSSSVFELEILLLPENIDQKLFDIFDLSFEANEEEEDIF
jgi:hypothetical protein